MSSANLKLKSNWLSADEALALLGVRPQTLYANVSRGKLRARPDEADPRRSRYHRGDVERLAAARRGRRPAAEVARKAMAWGEPVLASAISTVHAGALYYRGQEATTLAARLELEEVASLLWQGPLQPIQQPFEQPCQLLPHLPQAPGDAMARALLAMAQASSQALPTLHRHAAALRADASQVFHALANALLGDEAQGAQRPVSQRLAQAFGRPRAAPMLRQALVLLADHELNASTFAARVAVSTGASLAAGVLAGLATLGGPLHGRASEGLAVLVQRAQAVGPLAALREQLVAGQRPVAFGHALYPQGDVRAQALLKRLALPWPYDELAHHGERLLGEPPNVDFALSAMAAGLKLPPQAGVLLFALARSVGWLAHGLEQAGAATGPIRPRARYVGPEPRNGS